jgi:hypothetical protein
MNDPRPYQLRVLGESFEIRSADPALDAVDQTIRGFVTTRWVEAPSPLHAAMRAFDLIRAELGPTARTSESEANPTLTVVRIWPIESLDLYPAPGKGFTFFSDPSYSRLERLKNWLRELWYRMHPSKRPWTYSEPY